MTKQELQELRYAQEYINSRKRELELLKQDITYIRGIDYSKDKTGATRATQEDLICNMLAYENDIMRKTNELIIKQEQAKEKIFRLKNKGHQVILYKRYILCEEWEKIAKDMDYSQSHTYKLHGWALNEIKNI